MSQNARPSIKVSAQADKFRGFLQDVVSFEPDYILQAEKPRLHYWDEENCHVYIHELTTQQTIKIQLANIEELPREFASI